MAETKKGKYSDDSIQKAGDILVNTELIPCGSLIDGNYDGSFNVNINFKCGEGFDAGSACTEAQLGKPCYSGNGKVGFTKIGEISYKSKHQCTPTVAYFLSQGLKNGWKDRSGNGYEMRKFLPNYGFKCIASKQINGFKNRKTFTEWEEKNQLLPGDICVMTHGHEVNPINGRYITNKLCGHATMWNGKVWVSDYIQNHALVYNDNDYYNIEVYRFQECQSIEETDVKKPKDASKGDNVKKPKDTSKGDNGKSLPKKINVAFIGDGFSVDTLYSSGSLFPNELRKSANIDLNYFYGFAKQGATSEDYINSDHLKKTSYIYNTQPTKMNNNCKDVFEKILKFNPQYCIVALGGGGSENRETLNELCKQLKNNKIEVILVMLSIASDKMYSSISVGYRVNLMNDNHTNKKLLGKKCGEVIKDWIK